jgi:UDP-N-acetylmuramoyl-L-alanyl-D-glutamate--2,6-diaminopimelate ligase
LTIGLTSASVRRMTLYDLFLDVEKQLGTSLSLSGEWASLEYGGIQTDPSCVQEGDIFVAIRGTHYDSHQRIIEILGQNPAAVVVEESILKLNPSLSQEISFNKKSCPVVSVPSTRLVLALMAHSHYGRPSEKLFCVGVTGTNGKTSVTCLLEHLLNQVGVSVARLGTLGNTLKGVSYPSSHTTPGPLELSRILSHFYNQGAKACVMEVSSHALDQSRVDGLSFDSVVFLNLTHDHLDYHKTMEAYFESKQRLFTDLVWSSKKRPIFAVVHLDDPWIQKLKVDSKASVVSFGTCLEADIRYQVKQVTWEGTFFDLWLPEGPCQSLFIPLVGQFNVSNFIAAVLSLPGFGISFQKACLLLENFKGVPGRLQRVREIKTKIVFIDYAHTPDALEKTLKVVRSVRSHLKQEGQADLWLIFGCGGDRDQEKRPLMARIAQSLADKVILTADNPRGEPLEQIMDQIQAGFQGDRSSLWQLPDRSQAIEFAMKTMKNQDILVIAGKGHEEYQEISGEKRPFSDYQEVLKYENE